MWWYSLVVGSVYVSCGKVVCLVIVVVVVMVVVMRYSDECYNYDGNGNSSGTVAIDNGNMPCCRRVQGDGDDDNL